LQIYIISENVLGQFTKRMEQRYRTDFLYPSSSFKSGLGLVIDIGGSGFRYNYSEDPDALAIFSDWRIAGQDLSDAIDKGLESEPANEC